MGAGLSIEPRDASAVTRWDVETDVLIVGYGCAGASAALAASATGADVLILERAGGSGGASALAGGEIYLGGGTPIQQACGFDDTPEEMYKFLMAAMGPDPDEVKIATYADGSVEHFNWLVDVGVPFKPSLYDHPTWVPPTDDGLMWMGEKSWPFCDLAKPAPRGHRPQAGDFGGWLLMEKLANAVTSTSADTLADTTVERLVVDPDGRVVGVVARRYGDEMTLRARTGVVLAAGGFVFNDAMLEQFAPNLLGHAKVGTDNDDGRAIMMAQAVGAAIKRMEGGQTALMVSPPLLVRSILVNMFGQRFINEDTYPGRVGQMALFHQNAQTLMVIDNESFETVPPEERFGQQPTWVSDSIEELEREAGLPPRMLQATIDVYNHHAERGEDPVFHKNPKWLSPLRPPYGIIDVRPKGGTEAATGNGGFGVFTLGGLHTNIDGEVLNLEGDPIPGLFAAGRTTSGIQAWGYISGTSLGESTFFGRRAGLSAAAGD